MKRAALSEASLSIAPDMCIGWLAMMPTGRPSTRANAVMMAWPCLRGNIEDVAVVEDPQQDLVHVVGRVVGVRHDRIQLEIMRGGLGLHARG